MTLATLRTRAQARLESAGGAPYTDAQVAAALNEGQRLFGLLTLCVERTADVPLLADRPIWLMAQTLTDWLAPLRVRSVRRTVDSEGVPWNGNIWDATTWDVAPVFTETVTPAAPATLRHLDAANPAWETVRGTTVQRYGVQGLDLFFIHPCPADTFTALRITYAAQPQDLVADDDPSEIPEEYQPALISYALATLPLAFGGSELARFAGEWDVFLQSAQQCAGWMRSRSKAQRYDTAPPQLVLADRSREAKKKAR